MCIISKSKSSSANRILVLYQCDGQKETHREAEREGERKRESRGERKKEHSAGESFLLSIALAIANYGKRW